MCDLCDSSVAAWKSLRHHCGMFLDLEGAIFLEELRKKVEGSSEQTKQVHPSELKSFAKSTNVNVGLDDGRHIPVIGMWGGGFDEHDISFEFALFQVILFNHH